MASLSRFRPHVLAGVALLLALMEISQVFFYLGASGNAISLPDAVLLSGPVWIIWAIFTPLVFSIARRLPFDQPTRGRTLGLHLVTALALALAHGVLNPLFFLLSGLPEQWNTTYEAQVRKHLYSRTHLNLIVYAVIVGIHHALELQRRLRDRDRHAAELQASLTRAKLDTLRMQLNPHFLFNALHAVSTLILRGDAHGADRVLGRLGELLRASLDGADAHEVPLRREIEWLGRYLEIERVRFSDRLSIELDVPDQLLDAMVPYLALQPLVENAIRHGVATRSERGRVRIDARRVGTQLQVEVWNDGPELPSSHTEGVGLGNTRARLAQLHGDDASLALGSTDGGGVSAVIAVPFRLASPTVTSSMREEALAGR